MVNEDEMEILLMLREGAIWYPPMRAISDLLERGLIDFSQGRYSLTDAGRLLLSNRDQSSSAVNTRP